MPSKQLSHTNRRGEKYFLCRKLTKKGNPRYYFAKSPSGEPVYTIPDGYEIRESVNGLVTLGKQRELYLRESEIQAVEDELSRKPTPEKYGLAVKPKLIEVHQAPSGGPELLAKLFPFAHPAKVREAYLNSLSYSPVMQFLLVDEETRAFRAQRMGYRAKLSGWLWIDKADSIQNLCRRLIPLLGTDELFEIDIEFC